MSTTAIQESAIAAAFASRIPTDKAISAKPIDAGTIAEGGEGLLFSFTGEVSADTAVTIIDRSILIDGSEGAPLDFRLHDAIEAAVATLGAGALTDAKETDTEFLFADEGAERFALELADGTVFGHLAVRITRRPSAPVQITERRMQRIAGVDMELTVRIGRRTMPVRDVLSLTSGDVIELDRAAGAPADVELNGRVIAQGEVVVSGGDYAVRITRIIEDPKA